MQEFKNVESREPVPWTEWLTLTCAVNGAKMAFTPAYEPMKHGED